MSFQSVNIPTVRNPWASPRFENVIIDNQLTATEINFPVLGSEDLIGTNLTTVQKVGSIQFSGDAFAPSPGGLVDIVTTFTFARVARLVTMTMECNGLATPLAIGLNTFTCSTNSNIFEELPFNFRPATFTSGTNLALLCFMQQANAAGLATEILVTMARFTPGTQKIEFFKSDGNALTARQNEPVGFDGVIVPSFSYVSQVN